MTNYLIIPGLGNSGPQHWQTWFESTGNNFTRVEQKEWDAPVCEDWIARIDKAISAYDPATVVLIGHSLGCLTIVHWANQYKRTIKGALLVAPSDAEADVYTFPAKGFAPIPRNKLDFKSIIVASSNDVWVSLDRSTYFARCWGSELINIGEAGHINSASGHYQWHEGL
ncbi:MAG TPA: alpha/beta hydrolase, partial [Ferruginibacter sp.]|nr:alpha/beta hydrolase [Ferruginibacter sp.]